MPIWMCPKCRKGYKITGKEKKLHCICGEKYFPNMPTLPQKLWNFSHAIYKHWLSGMPTCTDQQVQERLAKCMQCELFTGKYCSHEACGCNVNGEVKFLNKLAWADQHCPEYNWDRIKPEWVSTTKLSKDILTLTSLLPSDVVAIVGVARSGLVVGSQIASYLHLPLYSLDIFDETLIRCGSGFRLRDHKEADGKYFIVDDTVTTCQTIEIVKKFFKEPHYTGAVYVTPGNEDKVDYFARQLATPHFLEWNFFNSHYNDNLSYDMDGVICQDSFLNDEKAFEAGIMDIKPKYLPRNKPIPIITGRPERLREATLKWLKTYGVQVKSLTMSQTRDDYLRPAIYKARNIKTKIFVESCPRQAKDIKELKPDIMVVCPTSEEVL